MGTLKCLIDKVCAVGEVLRGDIEVLEGKVHWVERTIYNPITKEVEIVSNYEFIDINQDNIDVNNPPKWLENYCYYILKMEEWTIKINE